jgi:hypothetical protein
MKNVQPLISATRSFVASFMESVCGMPLGLAMELESLSYRANPKARTMFAVIQSLCYFLD